MSENNQLAIEVAKNLLKIKAVFLKPNDLIVLLVKLTG